MVIFWLMGVVLAVSAAAVVLFRNPLHSALALVVNMITVAGVYAALEAHFLAVAQIIVYTGAVVVLILFVLLLVGVRSEEEKPGDRRLRWGALVTCALLFVILLPVLRIQILHPMSAASGGAAGIGREIFTARTFLFQAAGLLLLTSLVGAIMLARLRWGRGDNTGGEG